MYTFVNYATCETPLPCALHTQYFYVSFKKGTSTKKCLLRVKIVLFIGFNQSNIRTWGNDNNQNINVTHF